MSTTAPPEADVIKAASNAAVPPRGPRKQRSVEFIVFGDLANYENAAAAMISPGLPAWQELGHATVTGIFDAKMRDEAEAQITDKLPADEQGGPFVTIAAEHWQPREYEIIEQPPLRKPKGAK